MKTLTFSTRTEAEARSRREWEKVLGRPKRPEDVTEFFFAVDGASLLIAEADEVRLPKAEASRLRQALPTEADDAASVKSGR